jgi:large subunit ribosomal protein L29
VKAEELKVLDLEELGSRLKASRRELYELRFNLAVGQLENHREIRKVRKDIARILTMIHQRSAATAAEPAAATDEPAEQPEPEQPVAAARARGRRSSANAEEEEE